MTKAEIRIKYKNLRSLLSDEEIKSKSIAISENFDSLDIWNKTYFHIFLSIPNLNEVDTSYIIELLKNHSKKIVMSKSNFDSMEMTHFLTDGETEYSKSGYGITEPQNAKPFDVKKIEVVLIPLLAFDKKGHRVGYGKGFYDRFLSQCDPNCIFIGLSYFDAVESIQNINANDLKMNICVLPTQIMTFKDLGMI